MAINFKRIFVVLFSFVLIGLVLMMILQRRMVERFDMLIDKNVNLTGTIRKTLTNVDVDGCEIECKKTPDCIAANINFEKGVCWLKSTIGDVISDNQLSSLRYPCEIYDRKEFVGKGIGLDVGKYTLENLKQKGYMDKSLLSIRIRDGYKITVYDKDAYSGISKSFTTSQPDMELIVRDENKLPPLTWSFAVSSIDIEKV